MSYTQVSGYTHVTSCFAWLNVIYFHCEQLFGATGDTDYERSGRMSEKLKALDMALHQIEKQFGKGSIMRLGETNTTDIQIIPTGLWLCT
mgnify:FL=1